MEMSSSCYNLEFISENMEQKDRNSHCCSGKFKKYKICLAA